MDCSVTCDCFQLDVTKDKERCWTTLKDRIHVRNHFITDNFYKWILCPMVQIFFSLLNNLELKERKWQDGYYSHLSLSGSLLRISSSPRNKGWPAGHPRAAQRPLSRSRAFICARYRFMAVCLEQWTPPGKCWRVSATTYSLLSNWHATLLRCC